MAESVEKDSYVYGYMAFLNILSLLNILFCFSQTSMSVPCLHLVGAISWQLARTDLDFISVVVTSRDTRGMTSPSSV